MNQPSPKAHTRHAPESQEQIVPFTVPDVGDREIDAVAASIRSGWLTTGPITAKFEREFADVIGGGVECIAVSSATAGLHLALESLGLSAGDEVIVPTWTFTATAEVVRYLGADPIIVDVDPLTLNIDLQAAQGAVTPRTRAIIPVHFAGLPVNRSALAEFAHRNHVEVVEDAAHAFPATSSGEMIGSGQSSATVFSFYATKTMTTGEGGMISVSDPALADRIRTMRLHGISTNVFDRYTSSAATWYYEVVAPGFKYNLTDMAAAMGRVQLERAETMRWRRQQIALAYDAAFRDLSVIRPQPAPSGDRHSWHLYVIRLLDEARLTRDQLISALRHDGIGTSVHFIPLHEHPYWRDRYGLSRNSFPVASDSFGRAVSLPIYSAMTDTQISHVIAAVRNALK